MTTTHKIEFESVSLFVLAALCGVVFAIYFNHGPKIRTIFNLPILESSQSTEPSPTPLPKVEVISSVSPNGAKMVTMTVSPNKQLSKSYAFSVSDADGTKEQSIYSI